MKKYLLISDPWPDNPNPHAWAAFPLGEFESEEEAFAHAEREMTEDGYYEPENSWLIAEAS